MTISKSDLRKNIRHVRQLFVNNDKNVQRLFDDHVQPLLPLIDRCNILAAYDSFGSEVSVAALIAKAHEKGKSIALPFIAKGHDAMSFKRWIPGEPLSAQTIGFRQPDDDAVEAYPDLVLVPLVGFDRDMNRLGQGGGYYDRYLSSNYKAIKVGIAWSCQEVPNIPIDEWDVGLDAILTEKDWIVSTNSVIAS